MLKQDILRQKESQIAAQMSATLGYSNTENPFGDSNLNQKFVWVKKRELDAKKGLTARERFERDTERRRETELELEKLKQRRKEREEDQLLREQEQRRMQREQDRLALGDWTTRENDFHLEQAKLRAQIRVKEGRAKPIDVLAINLSLSSDSKLAAEFDALGLEVDLTEPYLIFNNLTVEEVKELHKDIQMYLILEKDPTNKQFWEAMMVVCNDELHKLDASFVSQRSGISSDVAKDIDKMLSSKTPEQLDVLQRQIEKKLSGGGPVDIDYWEGSLKGIVIWKAKARLRDMHTQMIRKQLELLKERGNDVDEQRKETRLISQSLAKANAKVEVTEDAVEVVEEYDASLSPKRFDGIEKEDEELAIIEEEEDLKQLVFKNCYECVYLLFNKCIIHDYV